MNIRHVALPVEEFLKIPKEERALLAVMGHSLNEFNIFNKLLIIASHYDDVPMQVAYAQSIQMYSIARVLVGKILEAWNAIEAGFFKSKLSKKYAARLSAEQSLALDELKAYFSRTNTIAQIRNNLAFHFSIEAAAAAPLVDLNEHDLSLYLGESRGNCLYTFSETIFNTELMRLTQSSTMADAFSKLVGEINIVDKPLNAFGRGVMELILADHIGSPVLRDITKKVQVEAHDAIQDLHIPFFTKNS